MNRSNRWLLLIGLVVLSLALAACQTGTQPSAEEAQEEEAEQEPVRIAVFHPLLGDSYTKAFTDGIEEAAGRLGGSVDAVFGSDFDPVVQSNQIQDAIVSQNYDAFIIYANDGNAIVPDVEDAVDAGLVVVAADVVVGPDPASLDACCGLSAMIGLTGFQQGEAFGEMVVAACGDKDPCEVAFLIGVLALSIDQERLEAVEDVFAEHPQIEMVTVQEAFYSEEEGYNLAQDILQSNPELDVFFSSGDEAVLGAEQALIDAGLEGEVALVGNGVGNRGSVAVAEGRFFASYALIPYTQGQLSGEAAIKAARGEDVESSIDMSTISPPLPSGGAIITQENADEFEPQW